MAQIKINKNLVRIALQTLFFLIIVFFSALAVRPLTRYTREKLQQAFITNLKIAEEALGHRILYESMSPGLLSSIDIRGLRLIDSQNEELLSAQRIKIDFNIFSLLPGSTGPFIRLLRLDGLDINIDSEKEGNVLSLFSLYADGDRPANALAVDVRTLIPRRILIRRSRLSFHAAHFDIKVEDFSAHIREVEGGHSIAVGAKFAFKPGGNTKPLAEVGLRSRLRINGNISSNFRSGTFVLSTQDLTAFSLAFLPQSFMIQLSEEQLELRKIRDKNPLDLNLSLHFTQQLASLRLYAEKYEISKLLALPKDLKDHSWILKSKLSGSIALEMGAEKQIQSFFDVIFDNSFFPYFGKASLVAQGNLHNDKLDLHKLAFLLNQGTFALSGQGNLSEGSGEGSIQIDNFTPLENLPIDANILFSVSPQRIDFFSDQLQLSQISLSAFNVVLIPNNGELEFQLSALRFDDSQGYDFSRLGRLGLEGIVSLEDSYLEFSLALDSILASDFLIALSPLFNSPNASFASSSYLIDLAKNLYISTEVFASSDFKHISWSAPRFVAAVTGPLDLFCLSSLYGIDRRFSLEDIHVIWPGGSAGGRLAFDFTDDKAVNFSTLAHYQDMSWRFNGFLIDGNSLNIDGDYQFFANVILGTNNSFSGSISFENMPLPFLPDNSQGLSLLSSFRYIDAQQWSANLQRFDLFYTLPNSSMSFQTSIKGSANQAGLQLGDVYIDDGIMPLYGTAVADWPAGFSSISFDARFSDALQEEHYNIDGHYGAGDLAFRLYCLKARLERIPIPNVEGTANAEIQANFSSLKDFAVAVQLTNSDLRFKSTDYRLSSSLSVDPQGIGIEHFNAQWNSLSLSIPHAHYSIEEAKLRLGYDFKGIVLDSHVHTAGQLETVFEGQRNALGLPANFSSVNALLSFSQFTYGQVDVPAFTLEAQAKEGDIFVKGGPENSVFFTMDKSGSFESRLTSPMPLRGIVSGNIKGGEITAFGPSLSLDLKPVLSLLPASILICTSGTAYCDLEIRGLLSDPEFFGTAFVENFVLELSSFLANPVTFPTIEVNFDGNEMSIPTITASSGKGEGTVAASFIYDRWIPDTFKLNIFIPEDRPIGASLNIIGVQYDGLAHGALNLDLFKDYFSISGALVASNSLITIDAQSMAEQIAESGDDLLPILANLSIKTGRKVEFQWPSARFPILRAYADANRQVKINYDGFTDKFSIQGDIPLRGGEVFYVQRNFYLREGRLLLKENELSFDPILSVRAEIRDRNEQGPVVILLIADPAPLSRFAPRFESRPALSQMEILNLLGQNFTTTAEAGEDGVFGMEQMLTSTVASATDLLTQFVIVRQFERQVRDILNLDMFSVRTQLLQNAVLGAAFNVAGFGGGVLDRKAGLGNYFDNTTVYMGKFIAPDLFTHIMLTMQVNEARDDELLGGFEIIPDIGIELATPLFVIKWNFSPENPKEILDLGNFITSNSFSIFWSKSF
jgi:translocation and assembly module TamB